MFLLLFRYRHLLVYDPAVRLSATEALRHSYVLNGAGSSSESVGSRFEVEHYTLLFSFAVLSFTPLPFLSPSYSLSFSLAFSLWYCLSLSIISPPLPLHLQSDRCLHRPEFLPASPGLVPVLFTQGIAPHATTTTTISTTTESTRTWPSEEQQ